MKKYLLIILLVLIALWSFRVFKEYTSLAKKEDNPEYQIYLAKYQEYVEKRYDSITNRLSQSMSIEFAGKGKRIFQQCILSNFEGAEVRLAGLQFYDRVFEMKSYRGLGNYKYQCNEADFDPDHPYFGLPDVNIVIGPVDFYQPEEPKFNKMFTLGKTNEQKPYKTYTKKLLQTDTAGNTTVKNFVMDLWLARFNVTITINSTRDDPPMAIPDSVLNARIYPGYWYGRPGKVSINDLEHKKETNDHLFGDLTFSLEINPNSSPWYVKMPDMRTARPDIAVAGVFCQGIKPASLNNGLDINTFVGQLEPLYYNAFEKDDTIKIVGELDEDVDFLLTELNDINRSKIWNRSYFLRIWSKNIGSRQTIFNQQDDKVDIDFMLPLLVVGSLDVIVPSNILPKWSPPEAHKWKFSLKNLLPKWGFKFGSYLSGLFIIAVILAGVYFLLPILKGLK